MSEDCKWLELVTRKDEQFLVHSGTGECICVTRGNEEIRALKFGTCGSGVLLSPVEPPKLVSGLLKETIVQVPQPDDSVELRIEGHSGSFEWHAERRCRYISKVCKVDLNSGPAYFETYHYACRKGPAYIYWAIPGIRKVICTDIAGENWVGEYAPSWNKLVNPARGPSHDTYPQNWGISTAGLVILCSRLGRRGTSPVVIPEKAVELLGAIVNCAIGSVTVPLVIENMQPILVRNGQLRALDIVALGPAWKLLAQRAGGAAFASGAHFEEDTEVSLVQLITVATDALVRISRERKVTTALLKSLLTAASNMVSSQIDISRFEPWWDEHSALALTPAPRTKRVERVSHAYKEALSQAVANTPRIQSTSQVLAVQKMMKEEVDKDNCPMYDPTNAPKVRIDTTYQYWYTCRTVTERLDRWHSSLDGLTVGSEHTVPFLHYHPQIKAMSFGAPQVLKNGRISTFASCGDDNVEFLQFRHGTGSAEPLRKKAKKETQEPRRASLDILLMWHNQYVNHGKIGLERWASDTSCLQPRPPKFLFLCLDWEQVQWCSLFFARNKLKMFIEGIPDYTHVRNRNHEYATDFAGERMTLIKGHCKNNVRRGPWQGKIWGGEIKEAAYCISMHVAPDSAFLNYFWPEIKDERKLGDEYNGIEGKKRFLRELPALACVDRDPPNSSPQRWMSYQDSSEFLDSFTAVDRMLFTFVCLRRKLVATMEELLPHMPVTKAGVPPLPSSSSSSESPSLTPLAAASSAAALAASMGSTVVPGKISMSKEKQAANAKFRNELKKSSCTLVSVAKFMHDMDFLNRGRRLCHVSRPEVMDHKNFTSSVDSPSEVKAFFANQAAGGYKDVICKMLQSFSDLQGLAHCGISSDPVVAQGLSLDSPKVRMQDVDCQSMMRFGIGLLKERRSSLAWHDMCWPGLSALFVHEDPEVRKKGLDLLRQDVEAMEWSEKQSSDGARLAGRSMLNGSILRQVVLILKEVNFSHVPDELQEWFDDFWEGLLQTVCSERANKILRDCATRDCPNKTLARVKRWDVLRRSDLPKMYKRNAIQVTSFQPVPANANELMESVFCHAEPKPPLNLKRILGDQDWDTFNSKSIRRLYGETFLMRKAKQAEDSSLLSSAWVTAFIPPCQVICVRVPTTPTDLFFALNNEILAVQTWPINKQDLFMQLETDPRKVALDWKSFHAWEHIYVIPTRETGPLHALYQRAKNPNVPVAMQYYVAGEAVPLLTWQSEHGFAGVRETELRLLKKKKGIADSLSLEDAVDIEDALATEIMLDMDAKLSEETLQERLHHRKLYEFGFGTKEEEISQTFLDDCLMAPDRKTFSDQQVEQHRKSKQRKERSVRIDTLMQKARPCLRKTRKTKTKLAAKVQAMEKKSGERWWASIPGNENTIEAYKPDNGVVYVDDQDGRFRLTYRGLPGARKSVSWSKIGMDEAVRESLRVLWSWAHQCGVPCPLPEDFIGELTA